MISLRLADTFAAIKFINESYFEGRDEAALRFPETSVGGRIKFRLPRFMFKTRDPYEYMMERMTKAHGKPTVESILSGWKSARWNLTAERNVALIHEAGSGLFILLTDTGN